MQNFKDEKEVGTLEKIKGGQYGWNVSSEGEE
mgnify:CR=1 FL=1